MQCSSFESLPSHWITCIFVVVTTAFRPYSYTNAANFFWPMNAFAVRFRNLLKIGFNTIYLILMHYHILMASVSTNHFNGLFQFVSNNMCAFTETMAECACCLSFCEIAFGFKPIKLCLCAGRSVGRFVCGYGLAFALITKNVPYQETCGKCMHTLHGRVSTTRVNEEQEEIGCFYDWQSQ